MKLTEKQVTIAAWAVAIFGVTLELAISTLDLWANVPHLTMHVTLNTIKFIWE